MGNCACKPKKKEVIKSLMSQPEEENPQTSIMTEGLRNFANEDNKPKQQKSKFYFMENLETQEDHASGMNSVGSSVYEVASEAAPTPRNALSLRIQPTHTPKHSQEFKTLSSLQIEKEMLLKVAQRLHNLGRAYHKEESYMKSLEVLNLAAEIYQHLELFFHYNVAVSDILLVHIVEYDHLMAVLPPEHVKPVDMRGMFLISAYRCLSGTARKRHRKIIAKYRMGELDVTSVIRVSKSLDDSCIEVMPIHESLIHVAHIFRKWLDCPLQALAYYKEALVYDSLNSDIYLFIGLTYKALSNTRCAIESYKKGIALNGNSAECCFNIGNLYFEDKNTQREAEKYYWKALKICQGQVANLLKKSKVLNMLYKLYYLREDLEKAFAFALKLAEEEPLNLGYLEQAIKLATELKKESIAQCLENFVFLLKGEESKLSSKLFNSQTVDISRKCFKILYNFYEQLCDSEKVSKILASHSSTLNLTISNFSLRCESLTSALLKLQAISSV